MTYEAIKQILDKFNITSLSQLEEQLEYYINALDPHYDDCGDDPIAKEKDCTNANCYEEFFLPDCRKLIEIYNKYFKKDITNRKLFIKYLVQCTSKKQSSIENYMYCRSCNQQIRRGRQASLKISDSEFKKDFCNNLSIKFNYSSLFEADYTSIKQFLNKEHKITSDTFIPKYNKEDAMTKDEENKLFDIVHTSKEQFQANLRNENNLKGSEKYLFNLASYAFERGLTNEAMMLLEKLEKTSQNYSKKVEFLQLKAKLLSNQKKDKEAIGILKNIIAGNKSNIDSEIYNLLAASIKRLAFEQYKMYEDEKELLRELIVAKDIYFSTYQLTKDYYPALNYMYLARMIAVLNNENKKYNKEFSFIWKNMDHIVTDWWSFMAQVEYLILIDDFTEAQDKLTSHFDDLDEVEISEFNIASTIRQLELYNEFVNMDEIKEIIDYLKKATTSK